MAECERLLCHHGEDAYAAQRGIEVIPEIDLPGHSLAAIGCYPQLGDYPFLPLIQFKWEASRNWTLQLEGARLSYINKVSDGLKWGPFVSVVSGTWTIHHDRRVRQFAWISGVAGIGADVGLGHWGSVRPRLVADVGFSFGNSGTIKTSNGSHDLEKYHYDPGFYLRAGLLFEF